MRLSLVVAAHGACDLAAFLYAMEAAGILAAPDVEIRIAHNGAWPDTALPDAAALHRHACPAGASVFQLWQAAILHSTADYVAVMDIQAPPAPGWLGRVQTAIAAKTPLFFGPVDPGWAWDDQRLIGYLIEYAQFRRPLPRALGEIPGNNLVGCRSLFLLPGIEADAGFSKTAMLWRVRRAFDIAPVGFDDMPVIYRKGFALRCYLRTRLAQGRAFAARRHEQPGQPSRLLCLGFTPLLPWLRVWRICRALRGDRCLRRALWRRVHLVLAAEVAWSLGEWLGYAAGADIRPAEQTDLP